MLRVQVCRNFPISPAGVFYAYRTAVAGLCFLRAVTVDLVVSQVVFLSRRSVPLSRALCPFAKHTLSRATISRPTLIELNRRSPASTRAVRRQGSARRRVLGGLQLEIGGCFLIRVLREVLREDGGGSSAERSLRLVYFNSEGR